MIPLLQDVSTIYTPAAAPGSLFEMQNLRPLTPKYWVSICSIPGEHMHTKV